MKKTFIILTIFTGSLLAGCKKYLDVNDNPNLPGSVSESLLLGPLEAGASEYIANGNASVLVNQWMQNCVPNQPLPNTANYLVTTTTFDDYWNSFYVIELNNLHILNVQALTNGNKMYAGIAKVLTAYTLGNATDLWGNIPYSKSFNGTDISTPTFDSQESIYSAIQSMLDSAITELATGEGSTPGADDYFYSGDMSKWIKMAYTLKARYYMHLTKASGHTAATQASLALEALNNGMSSNDDDCYFPYTGTETSSSPWYLHFFNTTTLVLASHYVDSLVSHADPRLPLLVSKASNTGLYTGNEIGSGAGNLNDYSVPGSFYGDIASNGYVLNAAEADFIKAEATYIVSGYAAAQPIYRKAIVDNMVKVGVDTSSTAAQTYLSKRGTLSATNAMQLIIEEKNIANNFSTENWVDWRRTGYPAISLIANDNITSLPRRFLYPNSEISTNGANVPSVKLTDRVWWDGE